MFKVNPRSGERRVLATGAAGHEVSAAARMKTRLADCCARVVAGSEQRRAVVDVAAGFLAQLVRGDRILNLLSFDNRSLLPATPRCGDHLPRRTAHGRG